MKEQEHLNKFLQAITFHGNTPIIDDHFTRTIIEYRMHETEQRRQTVRDLYSQAIGANR